MSSGSMSLRVAFAVVLSWGMLFFAPQLVEARSFTYPSYDVDIYINKDSTVDVHEKLTYEFNGTFRGVIRELTLDDRSKREYCATTGATCGGFERVALLGVFTGEGDKVPNDAYELYVEENEDTGRSYYTVKWEVWPGGKNLNKEEFTWEIRYRLYGSLGWIGTSEDNLTPYLYWNALPEDRGGSVDSSVINIHLPGDTAANHDDAEVFATYAIDYWWRELGNTLEITTEDLPSYSEFTVSYKLPVESVDRPAKLKFRSSLPLWGLRVKLDGVDLGNIGNSLDNFPTGKHRIVFDSAGFVPKIVNVDAVSGETIEIDATLSPTAFMLMVIVLSVCLNLFGVMLIPIALFMAYRKWRVNGRDINMPATIVPIFKPPEDVHPYLLGSLKDEKVDREDITGSIIDLAYRGYIKIKEISKGSNYKLIKRSEFSKDDTLDPIEKQLYKDIFGGKDEVETKKLGTKFASKYPKLQKKIYQEMVDRKYFKESPQTTRLKYGGAGGLVLAIGILVTVFVGFYPILLFGVPGPIFIGLAMFLWGLATAISAPFMPAKTASGSKVYAEVLGFRMYLHTAERYRLQGLDPEEFEKYLSYAIVFGIEKEWADKFKDIYKGKPDWYEGDRDILWDAYWVSRFSRSFSNSVSTTAFSSGTGSASGGGWSGGGGSFGGFSGGGGGGGGSGAF